MPFGAVAAVYAWDRLGAALSSVLREMFLIPVIRYVDDLFWLDFSETSTSCRLLALEVVALLGFILEETKTPPPGPHTYRTEPSTVGIPLGLYSRTQPLSQSRPRSTTWVRWRWQH